MTKADEIANQMAAEPDRPHQSQTETPEATPNRTETPESDGASSTQYSSDHFAPPPNDGGPSMGRASSSSLLTREEFFGTFELCFAVSAAASGYDSLLIKQDETEMARRASDGVYDICERHPHLHFMIHADGVYLKAGVAIGAFATHKLRLFRAEALARASAAPKRPADNDNNVIDIDA